MIMTMTELFYVPLLIKQLNNFFYGLGLLARGHAPSPRLWAPTSPLTVLANHSITSSVKY